MRGSSVVKAGWNGWGRLILMNLNDLLKEGNLSRRQLMQIAGLTAGTMAAKSAAAQVLITGGHPVMWNIEEPLKMFQLQGPEYTNLEYTLETNQGEVYTGNIAIDGTPSPIPVANDETSVSRLKAMYQETNRRQLAKKILGRKTDATTAQLTLRGTGYLSFQKEFDLATGEESTDLGRIYMFSDRENDTPLSNASTLDFNGNAVSDLELEMLMNEMFVIPGDGFPFDTLGLQGAEKKFYTKMDGFVPNPSTEPNQPSGFSATTQAELELAQQVAAEYASNPTDGSHDFSGQPDPIQIVPYTGDLPTMGPFDFQLVFSPNTDPEVAGDAGTFAISDRYIKVNRDGATESGLRVEYKKGFNLTGGFSGDTTQVTDSMRRTIRTYQALADGNNTVLVDMGPYYKE